MDPAQELSKALRFIELTTEEARRAPFTRAMAGDTFDRLPVHDEADAERQAALGTDLTRLGEAIDLRALPDELVTTVKVAQGLARRWASAARWYWLVHDPMGVGFYGMFGPTAYCGGMLLDNITKTVARHAFAGRSDFDRYLGLVSDLAAIVRAMETRLKGQAERGIVMPRPQLAQARLLVPALFQSAAARLKPDRAAFGGIDGSDAFMRDLEARISSDLQTAFTSLAAYLEGDYSRYSRDDVGLSQYKGGREVYEEMVSHYLTLDMSAEQVHAEGIRRMNDVREQMADLRSEVGFHGNDTEFLAAMAENPAWRAESPAAIAGLFRRYVDRFAPHMDQLFRFKPIAQYDAAPLPAELTGSMTFGYYQAPMQMGQDGLYLFNAANLGNGPLGHIAALNYHELVPGHHLHMASQFENATLPTIRKRAFYNAFNEGWAEYAATLAGEMRCYVEPEERFGRLMMEAFLTTRLVVDTGMNALGWSLEQARRYMRSASFMPETEICSESIRYSSDLPGQSLAYKIGDRFLLRERDRMKACLGDRFDIRDFHDAVLRPGALPLPLVAENIDRAIEALNV